MLRIQGQREHLANIACYIINFYRYAYVRKKDDTITVRCMPSKKEKALLDILPCFKVTVFQKKRRIVKRTLYIILNIIVMIPMVLFFKG